MKTKTKTATILFLVLIGLLLSSINVNGQRITYINGKPYRAVTPRPGAHPPTNNNQTPSASYNQTSQPSTNYQTPSPSYNQTSQPSTNYYTPLTQSEHDALLQLLESIESEVNVYAVIVGVSNYIDSDLNLNYPAHDAYSFYDFLTSDNGGNIPTSNIQLLLNENATMTKIKLAMNTVFKNAGPNDVVYFYFSGHGGDEGYFLTYDEQALVYSLIDNSFNLSKAKNKICIADACYAGINGEKVKTTSLPYDLGVLNSEPSMPKLMSCRANEKSIEYGNLEHGVFTYYLIEGLKGVANINGDDIITITELFNYVKSNVEKYTGYLQNPILNGISDPKMPMAVVKK